MKKEVKCFDCKVVTRKYFNVNIGGIADAPYCFKCFERLRKQLLRKLQKE